MKTLEARLAGVEIWRAIITIRILPKPGMPWIAKGNGR
jgi:hypothetical protein